MLRHFKNVFKNFLNLNFFSTFLANRTAPSSRLTLDFAPSDVAVPPTATGVLPPPAHECGTPCQPN